MFSRSSNGGKELTMYEPIKQNFKNLTHLSLQLKQAVICTLTDTTTRVVTAFSTVSR